MSVNHEVLVSVDPQLDEVPGTPVVVCSVSIIKCKWAEIFGIFLEDTILRRKFKDGTVMTNQEYWKARLVPTAFSEIQWTQMLTAANDVKNFFPDYLDATRSADPVTECVNFYDSKLMTINNITDIHGLDVMGDVPLMETWMWGSAEKKQDYPIIVDASKVSESEALALRKMVGPPQNDFTGHSLYEEDSKLTEIKAKYNLDFTKITEMSAGTIADIENPTKIVEPRRNKLLTVSNFDDSTKKQIVADIGR